MPQQNNDAIFNRSGLEELFQQKNEHLKSETEPTPPLTLSYGQKAVGLTFNPSNLKDVDDAKQHCADVIDRLYAIKHSPDTSAEKGILCEVAIREMQTAQMWSVKAITWRD